MVLEISYTIIHIMKNLTLTLFLLLFSPVLWANTIINENPLEANFESSKTFGAGDNTTLTFQLNLADKHLAYLEKFKVISKSHPELSFSKPILDPIIEFVDVFTKKKKKGIEGRAKLNTRLEFPVDMKTGKQEFIFLIQYQACTKDYCLLPIKLPVKVNINILSPQTPTFKNSVGNKEIKGPRKELTFQERIEKKGLLAVFFFVFIAGLLTSFTPCIYPMIPITLAVLGNKAHERNRTKNFLLSIVYVLGIAITYAFLGLFAAQTGALFGGFLGHPIAVFIISSIFIAMGLSMFGLFELQAPDFITKKLNPNSKSKNYKNAFLAGMAAGILASPCVGPVLVSILTYVAKTQNATLGFFLLFTFAMGFGQLFLALGTFSHLASKLPRSGPWMNFVKNIFGVVMFAMAAYYAYPVVKRYIPTETKVSTEKKQSQWKTYTDKVYTTAKANKQNIIIDFWADWCAACIELEEKTFSKPNVKNLLKDKGVVTLKYDATLQTEEFKKIKEKYGIIGLPNLIFYDKNGEVRKDLTLTGFEEEKEFIERINKLK